MKFGPVALADIIGTLAGITVTHDDFRRLGVGGLLMEIVSRPQLRQEAGGPKAAVLPASRAETHRPIA